MTGMFGIFQGQNLDNLLFGGGLALGLVALFVICKLVWDWLADKRG